MMRVRRVAMVEAMGDVREDTGPIQRSVRIFASVLS